jgi:hypothetical protein
MPVEKVCPSAILSTKNFTQDRVGIELGLLTERPANNCQSHGTALVSAREKIHC